MGSNTPLADGKTSAKKAVTLSYTRTDIRRNTEYCFIRIVEASATRSGFLDIWTSSVANRRLFYVRAIRQMHSLVDGPRDISCGAGDEDLQAQLDEWRWHLCSFAHLPRHLIVESLVLVLVEYVRGKVYDGADWQFTALIPARNMYSPLKPRRGIGAVFLEPDRNASEACERRLEDMLARAFDRTVAMA